jgi:hypothetical protein
VLNEAGRRNRQGHHRAGPGQQGHDQRAVRTTRSNGDQPTDQNRRGSTRSSVARRARATASISSSTSDGKAGQPQCQRTARPANQGKTVGVGNRRHCRRQHGTSYSQLVSKVGGKASQANSRRHRQCRAAYATCQRCAARYPRSTWTKKPPTWSSFQQYYTASSQIIKAAQETFSTLINSL